MLKGRRVSVCALLTPPRLRLAAVASERAEARDSSVIEATGHVRVGDLLMFSGLVSSEFIQTALRNFEEKGLPLGKVLTLSGYITEPQLRCALDVQALVNERQLPLELAVKVLTLAYKDSLTLNEAFERSGVVQPEDHLSNKLGQLVLDAQVVDLPILENALEVNHRTGLPLGHILCYRSIISQQILETALLGQQLIRRGSITREQCIKAIAQANQREKNLAKLPCNIGFKKSMLRNSPRIGELLFEAELIGDLELLESLQKSLATGRPSGLCMHEVFAIDALYITATVELQEMIDNGMLSTALAVDTFVRMKEFGYSFPRALAEASVSRILLNPTKKLLELLNETGSYSIDIASLPSEILERIQVHYNQSIEVCRALVEANIVDQHAIYSGLRLVYLLEEEFLTEEQALLALDMACTGPLAVDEAIFRLGWKKRTRLRED
jgi:hypothetical protein